MGVPSRYGVTIMPAAVFRVDIPGRGPALARGEPGTGPRELLPATLSLDSLLAGAAADLGGAVAGAPAAGPVPPGTVVLAPAQSQEIWAAGLTYRRSRDARIEEAVQATPYDLAYAAERPELFFKSPGWRARGPGQPISVRDDSGWDVPEPELALVLAAGGGIAGYTIGNDVSSRSIEGENPLYLPQAKVYDGCCALGPCIMPAASVEPPFPIRLEISRAGAVAFGGETSTANMHRGLADLARWLGAALRFPAGAVLLTGTGIVPGADFSLSAGDVVRISIGALGMLENPVELLTTGLARAPQAAHGPAGG
jgi:2-dehydro-3-deoxy-D-arabinonate dehydratase